MYIQILSFQMRFVIIFLIKALLKRELLWGLGKVTSCSDSNKLAFCLLWSQNLIQKVNVWRKNQHWHWCNTLPCWRLSYDLIIDLKFKSCFIQEKCLGAKMIIRNVSIYSCPIPCWVWRRKRCNFILTFLCWNKICDSLLFFSWGFCVLPLRRISGRHAERNQFNH